MKESNKKISSSKFDEAFEKGDVSKYLDLPNAKVNKKVQRVNIDFPSGLLKLIDREAEKIGVARTALIKIWLAERLNQI